MKTLSQIRTDIRGLINEADPTNSHFDDTELTGYINQAQTFLAAYSEYPRTISSNQVTAGTSDYTLPTDQISVISVYFGDLALQNDLVRLRVINEEPLSVLDPSWLSTNAGSRGRPRFAHIKNRTTLTLYPTPDTANAVTGKKYHLNYVQKPADLSADSDSPNLPLPYQELLQFYALHLGYLKLQVQAMADKMMELFSAKVKAIQSEVNKESKEALSFQWASPEDVNGDNNVGIIFP